MCRTRREKDTGASRGAAEGAVMANDHRVRITKMLLRESFLGLLIEKPIDKITVRELCEAAGVNRATFYAHYHDIGALNDEIKEEITEAIAQAIGTTLAEQSLERFSIEICRIIMQYRQLCMAFFGEHGDQELALQIVESFRESSVALWKQQRPDLPDEALDYLYTFASTGCLAIIRAWVHDGMKDAPEDIARFIERMASACLAAL